MDNKLSENLKRARIENGYRSQQSFADALHIHEKTVQGWESGKNIPDLDNLIRIADLLDVDLDYLTGRIEKPTHDLQFISAETGLSVDAIKILQKQKSAETPTFLSRIICHRLFFQLIRTISILTRPKSTFNKQFVNAVCDYLTKDDAPYFDAPEDIRAIYQTQIVRIVDRIVDDITDQKPAAVRLTLKGKSHK